MTFLSFLPVGIPAQSRLVFRPVYPQEIVPEDGVMGGAGWPVDWQRKRRKLTLEEQPEKHLRWILDKVVAEYYGEIIDSDLPKAVKAEAANVVRPFVARSDSGARVPKVAKVNWDALQQDAKAVGELLRIWNERLADDDDEEFLLLGMTAA